MVTNFLSIILISFIFSFNKSKYRLFNIIFIIILVLIIALNRQNNDYLAYHEIFLNPDGYSEIGYYYLIKVLKFFGATSHISVIIILSVFVLITFLRLSYTIKYFYCFIILYFVFLLPIDLTQIRYTFATFFVLNSIIDLSKKRYFIAFIYLFLSFTFHYFSLLLVFLVFLVFLSKYNFYSKRIYIKSFIGFIIVFIVLNTVISSLDASSLEIRTLNNYFSEFKIQSILIWGIPIILSIIVINYFKSKSRINLRDLDCIFILIMNISIFSLMFLSGLLYLHEFNRLYRTIFMLLNIAGMLLLSYLSLKNKIILFIYLFLINSLFGFYYSSQLSYDYIYWDLK